MWVPNPNPARTHSELKLPRAVVALLAATIAALSAFTAVASGEARAADGEQNQQGPAEVTFSVQPADAQGPDGRPFFEWGATPGATLKDQVAFVNYSFQPLALSIYSTDAINTDEGDFGLLGTDKVPQDAGAWVRITGLPEQVIVPARTKAGPGRVEGGLQVSIPADATPGDHSGGVVAVLTTQDDSGQGPRVQLEQRVASRVFVRVAGDVDASLAIEDLSASYNYSWNPFQSGSADVSYQVRNTGNVNLGASQVAEIAGFLTSQTVEPPDIPVLLPGNSVTVEASVDSVWPMIWMSADVAVTPRDPSPVDPDEFPVITDSVSFWAIPWLLFIVLLLAAALGYVVWRRRRRPQTQDSEPKTLVGVDA